MRMVFLLSVALVIAGSCLLGEYKDANDVKLGTSLAKAGYIVIVAVLAFITGFDGFLWSEYSKLSLDSRKVSQKVNLCPLLLNPFRYCTQPRPPSLS